MYVYFTKCSKNLFLTSFMIGTLIFCCAQLKNREIILTHMRRFNCCAGTEQKPGNRKHKIVRQNHCGTLRDNFISTRNTKIISGLL